MNSPWVRDVASSGFQWGYDNRNYLSKLADKMYLNKYRDYQEKTKRYKQIARGSRRLLYRKRQGQWNYDESNKRQKFSPSRVGDPLSLVSSKREAVQTAVFGAISRNLYGYLMTDIPLGVDNDDIQRRSSSINVKGCSINIGVRNRQGCPLFFNCALIVPTWGGSTVTATNFFANDGSVAGNNRYMDFDVNRTARQLHFANINAQSYVILHHQRMEINTTGDGDVVSSRANRGGGEADWVVHKRYVPINRVITYDDATGASAQNGIWFVFWIDRWDAAATSTSITNCADAYVYNTTYFKDGLP